VRRRSNLVKNAIQNKGSRDIIFTQTRSTPTIITKKINVNKAAITQQK